MPHTFVPGRPAPLPLRPVDRVDGLDVRDVTTMGILLRICLDRGVEVFEADLRDLRGALWQEQNRWRLYLNRDDDRQRRLFALARLLGHVCLHARPGRAFVEGGFGESPIRATAEEEREATAFAIDLLLPEGRIRRQLPGDVATEREVLALASRCGVSPLAAAVRLRTLGYRLPAPAA